MAHLTPREPMWTIESAQEFVQTLLPFVQASGYYLGITGSVLVSGKSAKDLDLIAYPATTATQDASGLELALKAAGLTKQFDRAFVQNMWKKAGSSDAKHVEVWRDAHKRRIDIFLLS